MSQTQAADRPLRASNVLAEMTATGREREQG
jgi:hypothetical protein